MGSTATMEGAYCSRSNELLKFSEQQLVDCVHLSFGCNGGNPAAAMKYLQSHAEMKEDAYPYTSGKSQKGGTCEYMDDNTTGVKNTGHTMLAAKNVDAIKEALHDGVISVA